MESEIEIMDAGPKGFFEKIKDWSYENWQTLLIILIVLIVGISAYNYNQNNANNNSTPAVINSENESGENSGNSQNNEAADNNSEEDNQEAAIEEMDQTEAAEEDGKTEEIIEKEPANENEEAIIPISDNSGKQYLETAVFGDGITHLARRALEKYIQETGDGANLSKEQKIYVEDYMQKRTGSEKIEIGHKEMFSESLIKEAISGANNLSEKSLQNLKKYIK